MGDLSICVLHRLYDELAIPPKFVYGVQGQVMGVGFCRVWKPRQMIDCMSDYGLLFSQHILPAASLRGPEPSRSVQPRRGGHSTVYSSTLDQ